MQALVKEMAGQGYPYYLAYNVERNVQEGDFYDLYIHFSESPIVSQGLYDYDVPASILYMVDSSNGSNRYFDYSHVLVEQLQAQRVKVSNLYHVYTNADFSSSISVQPDILNIGGEPHAQSASVFLLLTFLFTIVFIRILR